MTWRDTIPSDLQELYEVYDFHHAAAILASEFPEEFQDICRALRSFRFCESDIKAKGGNESQIPKIFSKILRPRWTEGQLTAKLVVDDRDVVSHDTHKIDYLRGRVALDVEWNSKDQTFDRDLYAFRAFFEYNRISVGVLVTRGSDLKGYFKSLGTYVDGGKRKSYDQKYGATTTHIEKLLPRLRAGRIGGCPVLVFGITTRLLVR